ncbi:MAG: PD-(D/E)XK nuclease family protein, partial [Candidatus Omnitrophica bacterium]|nr:PD-(D/E)XK nuclease family protein [Candidatus Omnitrophota bacterium]
MTSTTVSHSRLSTYQQCALQYKYRYVDKIKRDVETVEAFMGSRVHDTLEKLYRDLKVTKVNSIGDLITFYNELWEKQWHDGIWIVKHEYTAQDYRRLGERCLRDYYRR